MPTIMFSVQFSLSVLKITPTLTYTRELLAGGMLKLTNNEPTPEIIERLITQVADCHDTFRVCI